MKLTGTECWWILGGSLTGAVDVTSEVGFAWPRFLQNRFQRHEIIGPGISKVLVVRFVRDGNPSLVICRTDDTYVVITPAERSRCMLRHAAWSEHPLLMRAATARVPWMQITKPAPSISDVIPLADKTVP